MVHGWVCPRCQKVNSPLVDSCDCSSTNKFTPTNYEYHPCDNCPNNPKNGGSGFCGCVLPHMYPIIKWSCTTTGNITLNEINIKDELA